MKRPRFPPTVLRSLVSVGVSLRDHAEHVTPWPTVTLLTTLAVQIFAPLSPARDGERTRNHVRAAMRALVWSETAIRRRVGSRDWLVRASSRESEVVEALCYYVATLLGSAGLARALFDGCDCDINGDHGCHNDHVNGNGYIVHGQHGGTGDGDNYDHHKDHGCQIDHRHQVNAHNHDSNDGIRNHINHPNETTALATDTIPPLTRNTHNNPQFLLSQPLQHFLELLQVETPVDHHVGTSLCLLRNRIAGTVSRGTFASAKHGEFRQGGDADLSVRRCLLSGNDE